MTNIYIRSFRGANKVKPRIWEKGRIERKEKQERRKVKKEIKGEGVNEERIIGRKEGNIWRTAKGRNGSARYKPCRTRDSSAAVKQSTPRFRKQLVT